MLTPSEQEIYDFLLDKPSSCSNLAKAFKKNYHAMNNHIQSLKNKGYIINRPGENGYVYFVPEYLQLKAGRYSLGGEELSIEQLIMLMTYDELNFFQPHIVKAAMAVTHLVCHAITPRPDATNAKKTIIDARKVLTDLVSFLDKITKLSREHLLEAIGPIHLQIFNQIEEQWQNKHDTPVVLPSSKLQILLDNHEEKFDNPVYWSDVEQEVLE